MQVVSRVRGRPRIPNVIDTTMTRGTFVSDSTKQHRRWIRRPLIVGLGLAVVVPLLAAPGLAGAAPAPHAKPTPPPSPSAKVVPKPRTSTAAVPLDAPMVSFSQSTYYSGPGRELQVTAVASQDVGPTPYYISIYERWSPSDGNGATGGYVAICGSGSTCSATIRHDRIGMEGYTAFISLYPDGVWPTGVQSVREADGYFYFGALNLSASPTTVAVGGTSTLTASTDSDFGPTIYYAEIYDTTTSTRVGECASGTSCSVSVSQSQNTTHRYVAYLTDDRAGYPPVYPAATSGPADVTWAS